MKKSTFLKTLLLGTMLLGGASFAKAACSVTTDAYGMTKVVWDFAIEAKSGETSSNVTYYLDASTNAYVESSAYASSRPYSQVSKIVVSKGRNILSSADSNGRTGVIFSSTNYDGYVEFYVPFTGKLTITGKYLNNIGISDKSNSSAAQAYTTSGTNSTSLTTTSTVTVGHRLQIYNNSTTGGVAVTTITLEPESTWGEDNVAAGDLVFNSGTYLENTVLSSGTYQISSKGYKSIANKTTKDVFIAVTNSGEIKIDPNNENRGLKFATGAEFDFTPTNAGYLTIVYEYGADRGTWYIKNGDSDATFIGKKGSSATGASSTIYLPAGYRAQWVCGSGSNTSVLIRSITFTEGSPVTATMGKYGYTTFASSWPLDLANLPSGLNAYYVTSTGITNSKVTMTEANTAVPAGTGLILKGTANETYQIPVVASGSALEGNKLVGCTSNTDITSSTENYAYFYVLVNTETQAELQNINTYVTGGQTVTIPAGKAYLDATGVGAARLSIALDDETTGISAGLTNKETMSKEVYNLQGQRVNQPAKGLYIVNGKKVIIK